MSRHWPLVNDAALIRYITFILDSGHAPYREVLDMDLPGTFLVDHLVAHAFGAGATAWRCFDACVLLLTSACMLCIAWPFGRSAGIFSASLYWLQHLRDGIGQAGQRDLVEAALLLAAVTLILRVRAVSNSAALLCAGVCLGAASTIKPDSMCFALALGVLLLRPEGEKPGPDIAGALTAFAGLLIPWVGVCLYLLHEHALPQFWTTLRDILPYYASLGRLPFPELLRSWLPSSFRVLALVLLALLPTVHPRWTRAHTVIAMGVLWGLASFLFQGKGFPYQRYPSTAFLLTLAGVMCMQGLQRSRWPRALAAGALLYASLVMAPTDLVRILHAQWNNALLIALQNDLVQLGSSAALDDSVQCIDSTVGCNTVLLRLHLHQQTGMLSDFLIFGPPSVAAIDRARRQFWQQITTQPPRVMVFTGALHPNTPGGVPYAKLATWPAFAHLLQSHYEVVADRSFPPGMSGPLAYRIYVRRNQHTSNAQAQAASPTGPMTRSGN